MCSEKIKIYSPVNSVTDVKVLFGQLHDQLGFPRLGNILSYDELQPNGTKIYSHYKERTIIFEYLSSDYLLKSKYQAFFKKSPIDVLICWKDDCHLHSYLNEKYGWESEIERVIALQNYVEVIPNIVDIKFYPKNYYLINYDLADNDYKNNVDWSNSKLLKCVYNGKKISFWKTYKALVKQGDYIIGGFDIVRYENIKLLDSSAFVQLYKDFTDSPIGLFSSNISEIKSRYCNRGKDSYVLHIYYDNFFELNNKKLRKTIKEILPNFETSDCVVQALTEEEYNKLLGID